MKRLFSKLLLSKGAKLCSLAVMVASVAPLCCRSSWYQPEEPEGLDAFILRSKVK